MRRELQGDVQALRTEVHTLNRTVSRMQGEEVPLLLFQYYARNEDPPSLPTSISPVNQAIAPVLETQM